MQGRGVEKYGKAPGAYGLLFITQIVLKETFKTLYILCVGKNNTYILTKETCLCYILRNKLGKNKHKR